MLADLRDGVHDADRGDLLGVADAARRLGLKPGTVYKLAARVELPSVKAGTRVLFRPADLDAYTAARRRSPERVKSIADHVGRKEQGNE